MYGFKILCEISKLPFEISHKTLNPYPAKYAFYELLKIWRLSICLSYDIVILSETLTRIHSRMHISPTRTLRTGNVFRHRLPALIYQFPANVIENAKKCCIIAFSNHIKHRIKLRNFMAMIASNHTVILIITRHLNSIWLSAYTSIIDDRLVFWEHIGSHESQRIP